MQTTDYNGLHLYLFNDVYEPAEDSYLLAESVDMEKPTDKKVLEMGCGCGMAGLYAARFAKRVDLVDINPSAVSCAQMNIVSNKIKNASAFESDLFQNVKSKYDLVLFNPPYLPTDKETKIKGNVNYAFDGGRDGVLTVARFMEQADKHLKKDGKVYIILSSLGAMDKINRVAERNHFNLIRIKKIPFFFEEIYLMKMVRA